MMQPYRLVSKKTGKLKERDKLLLQYAAETRRFEIERFWQRTLFFWTVLGAAFVGYAALADKDPLSQLAIACFGFVASVAWTLQNRGAKYWQEAWEQKTKRHQEAVLGTDLFSRNEPTLPKGWFGAAQFSVSRITIILSDYTMLVWLGLAARSSMTQLRRFDWWFDQDTVIFIDRAVTYAPVGLLLMTAIFAGLMLGAGQSGRSGGERAN